MQPTRTLRMTLTCPECVDELEAVVDLGVVVGLWCRRCSLRFDLPGYLEIVRTDRPHRQPQGAPLRTR